MRLEDVKNAKKSEVTSQLVRMIGGGFPIDDTHRYSFGQPEQTNRRRRDRRRSRSDEYFTGKFC